MNRIVKSDLFIITITMLTLFVALVLNFITH